MRLPHAHRSRFWKHRRTPSYHRGGPDSSRGFAFVDSMTRGAGAHHQKVSLHRNRYGNFAFLGGIDLTPGRWDTNLHKAPENRKPVINRMRCTHELYRSGLARCACHAGRPRCIGRGDKLFPTMECLCRRPARSDGRISGRYLGGYPNSGCFQLSPDEGCASVARPRFRPGDQAPY